MANTSGHRRFGNIRKLPSGRYQVRYLGPDGVMRSAPVTFARKEEAQRWLTLTESRMVRDEWIAPERAKILLKDYAERWISQRANLRPRTVNLYTWILGKHVTPYLGGVPVGLIDTPMVREWRSELLAAGVSQGGAAKAYRLLRAVLMTAVKEDEIIRRNPCQIPGADQERAAERPTLTVKQVFDLAAKVPERYRALILLATFGCLRWGEVAAVRRCDVDAVVGTVRVREAFTEQRGKGMVLGPTKSRAGKRVVAIPAVILPQVGAHLDMYVNAEPDAFVFTTPSGTTIWRGNFNKLVDWRKTVAGIGAAELHFHDLRHTGNTLAARTGTSLRDLMTRMGHDNPRAALIYQHASAEADLAIAAAINVMVEAATGAHAEAERLTKASRDDDSSKDDEDEAGAFGGVD
ncbi:MAG: tyrosine-type recombinase/integrase [Myxococcales bacterium]